MARCPNCTETLHRGEDGDYPAQCPKCGVKLRSKSKQRATAVSTPAAKTPVVEERVVRSFSSKRSAPLPTVEEQFASPAAQEVIEDLPFAREPMNDAAESKLSETPFLATEADNPFVAPPPAPTATSTAAQAEINPFGGTAVAVPNSRQGNAAAIVRWSIIGVLAAGVVGVGAWFGKDLFSKPASKDGPGYHNPGRFYVFYALPTPWQEDKGRAARAGFDVVFHRPDVHGWVTLRTEPVKDVVLDPKEAADVAAERWKERFADYVRDEKLGKAKLAGHDAVVIDGEATLKDVPIRARTLVLIAGGVKYELGLEAPIAEWDRLETDFAMARDGLELTGGEAAPIKTLGESDMTVFASKKFPCQLSAPARTWREVPDLQTDSRFDDLKIQDKARQGEVVVAPRETKDLPGMRVRYVETQTKRYENKVREVESNVEKLTIRGRKAIRTMLIVANAGGDFFLYTTFIEGDGLVFQIQGRAPVDKRDYYEPIFARIADSFEVLAKAPEPPKKDETPEKTESPKSESPPTAKATDPPKMEEKKTTDPKPEPAKSKEPEKKTEAKKDPAKETPKKDDAAKKPDAPKKKKSLDDLD
jgi:hypothetical protein